jgi:hypothetical protein
MTSKSRPSTLVREKLRSDSFINYKRVMSGLFQQHESYGFVGDLAAHFRSGRFDLALGLADSLSEQSFSDATTHFVANQFALLIRKYPWDPKIVKTDPESRAIRSFRFAERRCQLLNRKFLLLDKVRDPYGSDLNEMRRFIRYVLGDSPNFEEISRNCAFGAGASIGVHGNATNIARKVLSTKWTVSPGAFTYGYWAMMRDPNLRDVLLESRGLVSCLDWSTSKSAYSDKTQLVNYNKISFVPKTAKTHRAIAVEPLLNGYLQKGVDEVMRKRLLRVGIDLRDQSENQRKARLGSLDDSEDSFSTIDLSSASDSISIGLARNLLPPDWFDFLNAIRSHSYELNGRLNVYHKFCSMGNGFCFPLETLIFAACCVSCGAGSPGTDFSVYGDDIIVRRKHFGRVLKSLRTIGFLPNASKTFCSGLFRESCGADWFGGVDVRPYTLDYALDSIEALYKWLNLTRRSRLTTDFFSETYPFILGLIPHQFQFFRPFKGNADSGIDVWADQHLTSPHCSYNYRSNWWVCKELRHIAVLDKGDGLSTYRRDSVDMYALLSGLQSADYRVGYTLRRKTRTTVSKCISSSASSSWLPVYTKKRMVALEGYRRFGL